MRTASPPNPGKPQRNTTPNVCKLPECPAPSVATMEEFNSNICIHNHIAVQERIPQNRLDTYNSCASDFIGIVKPSHRLLLYSLHPWAAFRLRQMDIPLTASVILHTRRIQSELDTGRMMGWYPRNKLQLSCNYRPLYLPPAFNPVLKLHNFVSHNKK